MMRFPSAQSDSSRSDNQGDGRNNEDDLKQEEEEEEKDENPVQQGAGGVASAASRSRSAREEGGDGGGEDEDEDEEAKKLEAKRAYNRMNAARARTRTKKMIRELIETCEDYKARNRVLEREQQELKKQMEKLRHENKLLRRIMLNEPGSDSDDDGDKNTGGEAKEEEDTRLKHAIAHREKKAKYENKPAGGFPQAIAGTGGLKIGDVGVAGAASAATAATAIPERDAVQQLPSQLPGMSGGGMFPNRDLPIQQHHGAAAFHGMGRGILGVGADGVVAAAAAARRSVGMTGGASGGSSFLGIGDGGNLSASSPASAGDAALTGAAGSGLLISPSDPEIDQVLRSIRMQQEARAQAAQASGSGLIGSGNIVMEQQRSALVIENLRQQRLLARIAASQQRQQQMQGHMMQQSNMHSASALAAAAAASAGSPVGSTAAMLRQGNEYDRMSPSQKQQAILASLMRGTANRQQRGEPDSNATGDRTGSTSYGAGGGTKYPPLPPPAPSKW